MPKQKNNHIIFLSVIGCFLLMMACTNRPKEVLSSNKMAAVLIDLHKLDGTLVAQGMEFQTAENVHYYEFVLEKHHVTQAIFDSSLVWYARNPKRFEKVYIKVVENITDWEKQIAEGKYHPIEPDTVVLPMFARMQLWNDSTFYHLTCDSARTELAFKIENDSLLLGDLYILSFLQRVAPEDSTDSRQAQLFVNYLNGKSDTLSTTLYNDSVLRRFTFYKFATDTLKIKSIAGKLLAGTDYKGTQNVFIDSVSLVRRYEPAMQDSLRMVVEVNDTTKIEIKVPTEQPKEQFKKKLELIADTNGVLPIKTINKPFIKRSR